MTHHFVDDNKTNYGGAHNFAYRPRKYYFELEITIS
jgi:hypothetical protein